MERHMRNILIALTLCWALPAAAEPATSPLAQAEATLVKCNANIANIAKRMQVLVEERERIVANAKRLEGGDADPKAIGRTVDQVQKEIDMRGTAIEGLKARCEAIAQRVHTLKSALPL